MAKILFLTQTLPYPLDAGPKVRQYHMLRYLAQRHHVTLVAFRRPDDSLDAVAHLEGVVDAVTTVMMRRSLGRNVWAGIKSLGTGLPLMVTRDEISEMKATLRALVGQSDYDVIHADQLSMAGYGQFAARESGARRPRTLLDEHNAFYLLVRRMAATEKRFVRRVVMRREAHRFAAYEAAMCDVYDAVLTVIPEDRDHLVALMSNGAADSLFDKITVVPICVDPDREAPVIPRKGGPPTILHVGTMFWPPNVHGVVWFAREVLPLIHKQIPDARFVVVGKKPPAEVQSLASDARIQVTGYVPELLPFLEEADAFVVPLHAGSGMRVKILDAWMWAVPVISTPLGAEGIEIAAGDNILLAEDASDFAAATLAVLADSDLNQRLRRKGRSWVEQHYGWQHVYGKVDQVYSRLLGGRPDG